MALLFVPLAVVRQQLETSNRSGTPACCRMQIDRLRVVVCGTGRSLRVAGGVRLSQLSAAQSMHTCSAFIMTWQSPVLARNCFIALTEFIPADKRHRYHGRQHASTLPLEIVVGGRLPFSAW